ncbi:hypothetical protein SIL87_19325 [Acidiphilium acidophilum]|uniref:Uncharacterized protein n=1 Tax=Acidiphilium acidophilum TaxID=76588 RepID=A0AAW9DY37_ACIAO|nr:hypothetical protein [Acidiphilium acidophilum]MDX5932907.1 hypothetical protein [Acidiphilium acidophilum]MEE3503670.1 hypothetical protein [Acidiphilium acidophilum]
MTEHADIRRAVNIDMARVGIDRTPFIPARLQTFEPENAGQNELARGGIVRRIYRTGGCPCRRLVAEHRVGAQSGADFPCNAKGPDRRAVGIHPLPEPAQRGRDRPSLGTMAVAEQIEPLPRDIDRDEIRISAGVEAGANDPPIGTKRLIASEDGDLAGKGGRQMRVYRHGGRNVRRGRADRKGRVTKSA